MCMIDRPVKDSISYEGKFFDVVERTVVYRSDESDVNEAIRFHVRTGVAAIPLIDETRVLLVNHFHAGIGTSCTCIPRGGLESGMDPKEQMIRELEEETGYTASSLTWLMRLHPMPGYVMNEAMFVFVARDLTKVDCTRTEPYDIRTVPLALTEVPQLIRNGTVYDAVTVASLLYYMRIRESL